MTGSQLTKLDKVETGLRDMLFQNQTGTDEWGREGIECEFLIDSEEK